MSFPCGQIHPAGGDIAYAGNISQKQQEWLQGVVADAITSPRAVMVHFIDATLALTAVVNAFNFHATTFHALIRVFVNIFRILVFLILLHPNVIWVLPF